jgi:hypothetical protein
MRQILLLLALVFVAPAAAQMPPIQIDPGMTRAQVVERLGNPATERASNGFTYLFFINGCERTCGMNDLVTLRGDSVVDAIFRAPQRTYSGRSTSPQQNRTPVANRGPLTVTPARDSVVMRIVPADSTAPRPATPPPSAQRQQVQPAQPARELPIGDLTGRTIVPGARPDSLRGSRLPADPRAQPDTARPGGSPGRQPPVVRSDTVMNPRTPVVPRPDSTRPVPPPAQPPPAT